jgi:hypothetical protein
MVPRRLPPMEGTGLMLVLDAATEAMMISGRQSEA